MFKRLISCILALFVSLCLFSCDSKIYGHAEMTVPLPQSYESFESENFDKAYSDGKSVVAIYRISYQVAFNQGISDALTPEQFARFYMNRSERKAEIKFHGTTPYYEYTAETDGIRTSYLASFFRSKYAYFLVLFASPENYYNELRSEFLYYVEGVIFSYDS